MTDDVCLAVVGVLKSEPRQGYGTAIVVKAVEDCSRQHKVTASTPSGAPMYKRLGYRPVTIILVYERQ